MTSILCSGDALFLRRHRGLLAALERRGFAVDSLDVRRPSLTARARLAGALARFAVRTVREPPHSIRGPRASRAAFARSAESFSWKSAEFERAIAGRDPRPDAILHVFGLASPFANDVLVPYAHYLDYTFALAARIDGGPLRDVSDSERRRFLACERRGYERAARIFTMSRLVRDSIVNDYGVPDDRVEVVGAGSNIPADPALPKVYGTRRLLFNASDFSRKGGELVMSAFRAAHEADPSLWLVVVGASLPPAFANAAGVEPRGRVTPALMRDLYARSDVVLAPATNDPFPGVVIEAMAHGTPAIVRARDGMPEIVTDDVDGIVLSDAAATPEALARTIRSLVDDDARLRRFSAAARDTIATRLNWDVVAEKMDPFFRRLRAQRDA